MTIECSASAVHEHGARSSDRDPLVSIGLPVYNGERFLRQAVDSLLAQTFADFELIISDNASTDATESICREYLGKDRRIRYYRNGTNIGPTANFNRVFALSVGHLFMWASHDDYWEPECLESCLEGFRASPDVVLVGAKGQLLDAETAQIKLIDTGVSTVGLGPAQRLMRYKLAIHNGEHVGVIFYGLHKRAALSAVLPMKAVISGDQLLLAALCFEGEFRTVPRVLMTKRWGSTSASYRSIAQALGSSSSLMIATPMLVRELFLQSLIFRANQLTLKDKVRLSWWSLRNYLRRHCLLEVYCVLPPVGRWALSRVHMLWRQAAKGRSRLARSDRRS